MSELRLTVCDCCGLVSVNGSHKMESFMVDSPKPQHVCRVCEDEPFKRGRHPKYVALETTLLALVKTT